MTARESLPTNLAAAHAMIVAERAARIEAEAHAARVVAENSNRDALIAHLKLQIEKLRREFYGSRSERKARLLDQMELELEDLQAGATEDELAAEQAAVRTQTVRSFERKRPARKPFPTHLPRERIVIPAPECCPCCGSAQLSKLGEDITETLEVIPRRWKVIQTVREKFSCRACETISPPPAPFHVTAQGFAGPNLLAMILFEKFGQHQPLNRQSERYRREGIDLSVSTLADQVGACTAALKPLHSLIEAHVLTAERLHADDTTVPILAKGKTVTGHIWTYVRDDRPFGGRAPPAALYYASRDRRHEHPERHLAKFGGILQADAYSGYNTLFDPARPGGAATSALCWSHARRQFFELADIAANARRGKRAAAISPIALKAVNRIDALFDIERTITGSAPTSDSAREPSGALEQWLRQERSKLSRSSAVAQPIDYMLKRRDALARFLHDGRICLTNNAAERALRGFALGRKSWLFVGSERAAAMTTLITTAKLNNVDPLAWLADLLTRIADTPQSRLPDLSPGTGRRCTCKPPPEASLQAIRTSAALAGCLRPWRPKELFDCILTVRQERQQPEGVQAKVPKDAVRAAESADRAPEPTGQFSGSPEPPRRRAGRRTESIDKSTFVSVTRPPCLICGHAPSDAHHLRFAQWRALGRKVSDEFTVALCRGHHREVHGHGGASAVLAC